jgi:hypothetical protein
MRAPLGKLCGRARGSCQEREADLRSERRPMLRAPIPDTLRSNSLIRADDTIDGMTLKQLSTGIL